MAEEGKTGAGQTQGGERRLFHASGHLSDFQKK